MDQDEKMEIKNGEKKKKKIMQIWLEVKYFPPLLYEVHNKIWIYRHLLWWDNDIYLFFFSSQPPSLSEVHVVLRKSVLNREASEK